MENITSWRREVRKLLGDSRARTSLRLVVLVQLEPRKSASQDENRIAGSQKFLGTPTPIDGDRVGQVAKQAIYATA